jgi:hypothetical protein
LNFFGHTLLLGNSSITIAPNRADKLRFDPMKEFVPVSMFGTAPSILLANPSAPFKSVKELVAFARTRPGALNCATSGIGTTNDLGVHLLNFMSGIRILNVPYKGSGPSLNAALGNETPELPRRSCPLSPCKTGGGAGDERRKRNPRCPMCHDRRGVPGYEAIGFFSIVASRKVPKPVIERCTGRSTPCWRCRHPEELCPAGLDVEIMTIPRFAGTPIATPGSGPSWCKRPASSSEPASRGVLWKHGPVPASPRPSQRGGQN